MIVLENVTKTYQMGETTVQALRGISLHIREGEFVSLIGASGSGKSTLLHMIGLLDRPDTGILRIAGILNGTCNYILSQMRERGRELAEVLARLHPYDTPEIIATSIVSGHGDYLAWIAAETAPLDPAGRVSG